MLTRGQIDSYHECAKSLKMEESGPKESNGKKKKKRRYSRGLGLGYKGRSLVPFFNLLQAHKCGPKGPKKHEIYDSMPSTYDDCFNYLRGSIFCTLFCFICIFI